MPAARRHFSSRRELPAASLSFLPALWYTGIREPRPDLLAPMMSGIDDVADSTDWLATPIPGLATVESALRCQICKDFYDAPVITACSHTFCSACIRRSLSAVNAEKKCPLCWAPFEERQLRKNTIVEDLVRVFTAARPDILRLGKEAASRSSGTEVKVGRKRKITEVEEDFSTPSSRKTRSQSRRSNPIPSSVSPEPEEMFDNDDNQDTSFEPGMVFFYADSLLAY